MKTEKSFANGENIAVLARGNGFYYAIRRYVTDAVEARRTRLAAQHVAQQLAQLPDYLKQDIDWPAIEKHEER